jgi:hypothetical protein
MLNGRTHQAGSIKSFNKAVGSGIADLRLAVLDVIELKKDLISIGTTVHLLSFFVSFSRSLIMRSLMLTP